MCMCVCVIYFHIYFLVSDSSDSELMTSTLIVRFVGISSIGVFCKAISMCTTPIHMSSGESHIFHVDFEEVTIVFSVVFV